MISLNIFSKLKLCTAKIYSAFLMSVVKPPKSNSSILSINNVIFLSVFRFFKLRHNGLRLGDVADKKAKTFNKHKIL